MSFATAEEGFLRQFSANKLVIGNKGNHTMQTVSGIRHLSEDEVAHVAAGTSVTITGPLVVLPKFDISVKNTIATVVVGIAIASNSGSGSAGIVIVGIGGNTTTVYNF